ncbi:YadA C-terminal domain-containing protein [Haemophilus sp. oral taxon 036]|uniref:YadA-like family protein n=1 Tax=Haemophilus sp. oral taxon 036 TaxID=712310 RepID=UPI001F0C1C37|nr:YadA C-terminal domain-containing protein [Haemophilus sp. oral taxon 036]
MKYELLKRTAIALFVGGIVSTYAMADDKAVDEALAALGKAINANATKQTEATEAVKSELTKKIEEQDKKINDDLSGVASDLVGVAANSYNNTLTLNGFKAGEDVLYDVDTTTGAVSKKTATEEDVKNDPLEGKGVLATVIKNKNSLDGLSEDLGNLKNKVDDIGETAANKEDLGKLNDAVVKLQEDTNEFTGILSNNSEDIAANKEAIDINKKDIETLKKSDQYRDLIKVKDLVENKADKQALEDLKKEVKDNEEEIGKVSDFVNNVDSDVDELVEEHNSLAEKHDKLVEGVKKFTEEYNVFTNATNEELNKKAYADDVEDALSRKANVSDVYTKAESNSKLDAKADKNSVYSKSETDNKFALKADNSVVRNHTVDIDKLRTDVNAHTKRLDHLDNRVNKLDKDLKRGLAAQAALTGLFQPYTVGKANFTAAVGGYKSQTAVAVGTGYRYNQNIATKAGVAFTQGGGVTYNAGVNFEW